MSAPETTDPLVVNTTDGTVWTRREATRDGLALYAPEKCAGCPEFVMATYAELEGHGVAGSANVLPVPVPVGPEPQALSDADELAAFRALELGDLDGRVSASCGKPNHLTWLRKRDDTRACPWCVMELQNDSLVARTHQLANYQEIERNFWANQRADESLAAVANRRIAELNRERDELKARVAELEAERHSTNEALSDAAVRMRVDRDRIAELEALTPARVQTCRVCGAGYTYGQRCTTCEFKARMASELQAQGLDGEFHAYLHHPYQREHDMPETGGA